MYKSNGVSDRYDSNYNTYSNNTYNNDTSVTTTETHATTLQYYYCVFSLARGIIARLILLYALITMSTTVPYQYAAIVLFEWFYNTYASYKSQTYFPGSAYNYIYTIQTGQYWTGDYHDNKFSVWVKLRMLLLVISLNLSISIALSDNYSNNNDSDNPSMIHTVRVLVPLILEISTVLLNTIFTLTLYAELFIRIVRYVILIVLNMLVRFTSIFNDIAYKIHLFPLSFSIYRPSTLLHSDLESGFINSDSEEGNTELFDYYINRLFWPIYTFLFKWIGY